MGAWVVDGTQMVTAEEPQFMKDAPFDLPTVDGGADSDPAKPEQLNLAGLERRGQNLDGVSLAGRILVGADLSGCSMIGASLTGADLRLATLTGANLNGADLSDALLDGADMRGASLRRTDMSGASARRTRFAWADLWDAAIDGADVAGADFSMADLRDISLGTTDLRKLRIHGARLTETQRATIGGSGRSQSPESRKATYRDFFGTVTDGETPPHRGSGARPQLPAAYTDLRSVASLQVLSDRLNATLCEPNSDSMGVDIGQINGHRLVLRTIDADDQDPVVVLIDPAGSVAESWPTLTRFIAERIAAGPNPPDFLRSLTAARPIS